MNASLTVYYSTPFGENSKGETIPWIYHDDDLNMDFYPVFLSQKICSEYFKIAGRAQFLIIKGDLESALGALDVHPLL